MPRRKIKKLRKILGKLHLETNLPRTFYHYTECEFYFIRKYLTIFYYKMSHLTSPTLTIAAHVGSCLTSPYFRGCPTCVSHPSLVLQGLQCSSHNIPHTWRVYVIVIFKVLIIVNFTSNVFHAYQKFRDMHAQELFR